MFVGELSAGILSCIGKYCWVYSDFEVILTSVYKEDFDEGRLSCDEVCGKESK